MGSREEAFKPNTSNTSTYSTPAVFEEKDKI